MSSGSDNRRNNVRAGLFTLSAILLFFATMVVLNGSWLSSILGSFNRYVVRFELADGVEGLNVGSQIRVGGLVRGAVTGIELIGFEDAKQPTALVSFEVDEVIDLWSNAVAIRTASILGGGSWINISTVGGADVVTAAPTTKNGTTAELLPTDGSGTIDATPGDGLLTTIVGGRNAETTRQILTNVSNLTGFVDSRVKPVFEDQVEPALVDARTVVASVSRDYEVWSGSIGRTLDNVETASSELESTMEAAQTAVRDVRADLHLVSELVQRNIGRIDEAVANLEVITENGVAITRRIKDDTLARVDEALDGGVTAIGDASRILQRLEIQLTAAMPSIRAVLQDAMIAAGELKLATIEIRRSPWRILYKPSPTELANENLFAAARDFTIAAGEARVAAESFQAVMENHPDRIDQDPELQAMIERFLADTLKRLEAAQSRLFSVIIGDQAPDDS
jgi:ABC-type transporter Mla subunit MlaD